MAAAAEKDPVLMPLRPELEFYPGPAEHDGSPTTSIHDPLTGVYHKVGWAEAEVLQCLRRACRLSALVAFVQQNTILLDIDGESVLKLYRQATQSGLTMQSTVRDVTQLMAENAARKLHPLKWLLMHYLYFRIPLLYPASFLSRTLPLIRLLTARPARYFCLLLSCIGVIFVLESPGAYFGTFPTFFSFWGVLTYGVTVALIKVVHEFSHAYIATALGVRVRSMGIACMVFWPIPFCDVTDAWKLRNRRDRALIGFAGIIAEIVIAGFSLFMWGMCPDGVARSLFFVLSSTSMLSTLLVNLNPAMRFDGYYILTDLWGMDNLQMRAFAMTKWKLRKSLLGLEDPVPEAGLSRRHLTGMMAYSIYTWIYRVGLYLGIAVLVYYKFTKILGIILFAAELGLFLVAPVIREGTFLMKARKRLSLNGRLVASLTFLLLVVLWLALPLKRTITIQAISVPIESQLLYARQAGRIQDLSVDLHKERTPFFKSGEPVVTIFSEDLNAQIEIMELKLTLLKQEIEKFSGSAVEKVMVPQKRSELRHMQAQLDELNKVNEQNHITSRVDGDLVEWDPSICNGRYVSSNAILGRIVGRSGRKLVAYLPEDNIADVRVGEKAIFYPKDNAPPVEVYIRHIDSTRANRLEYMNLAVDYGGELLVSSRGSSLVLLESYYRLEGTFEGEHVADMERFGTSGVLKIASRPKSLVADMLRQVVRVVLRESSF